MPTWVRWLLDILIQAFTGKYVEIGRDEVRKEVTDATDKIEKKHAEIDAQPADVDDSLNRLRARRAPKVPRR